MSPAIADVAAGHIPFMFSPIPFAEPLTQAGKLRLLGVTTAGRIDAIPEVPPLTEAGVKDFDAVSWFMLVAPAGTPPRHRRQTLPRVRRHYRRPAGARGVHPAWPGAGAVAAAG